MFYSQPSGLELNSNPIPSNLSTWSSYTQYTTGSSYTQYTTGSSYTQYTTGSSYTQYTTGSSYTQYTTWSSYVHLVHYRVFIHTVHYRVFKHPVHYMVFICTPSTLHGFYTHSTLQVLPDYSNFKKLQFLKILTPFFKNMFLFLNRKLFSVKHSFDLILIVFVLFLDTGHASIQWNNNSDFIMNYEFWISFRKSDRIY